MENCGGAPERHHLSIRKQQIGPPEAIENRGVIERGASTAPRCVMQQRLGPTDLETRDP
jgi:hypothetical protein